MVLSVLRGFKTALLFKSSPGLPRHLIEKASECLWTLYIHTNATAIFQRLALRPFFFQIQYFEEFNGYGESWELGRVKCPWSERFGEYIRESGTHWLFMLFEGGPAIPRASRIPLFSPEERNWEEDGLWSVKAVIVWARLGEQDLVDWQIVGTHRRSC